MKASRNIFLFLIEFLFCLAFEVFILLLLLHGCHTEQFYGLHKHKTYSWDLETCLMWYNTNVVLIAEKKTSKQAQIGAARCITTHAHAVNFII